MKNYQIVILAACSIFLLACNQSGKSIAGVYVVRSENEFTKLDDTLVIEAYNLEAHSYTITKRSGYNLIREGKVLPRKFNVKSWTATYNVDKQMLQEGELGKQLYVNPDEGTIKFGAIYHKL